MNNFTRALIAFALLLPRPAMAAAKPQEFFPAGSWDLDYSRDSCNLLRDFKDSTGAILSLRMEQFRPGTWIAITLVGQPAWTSSRLISAKTHFIPGGGETVTNDAMSGTMTIADKRVPIVVGLGGSLFAAPDQNPMPVSTAEFDTVQFDISAFPRPLLLHLGEMKSPLGALQTCMDDLVRHWGLDPTVQKQLTPPMPIGDAGKWIVPADYPDYQMFAAESSTVHFRLMVDASGKVTGCQVQDVVQAPVFAERTCTLLTERAHFTPARDAKGNPVASYYANSVKWRSFAPWEERPPLPAGVTKQEAPASKTG